MRIRVSSTDAQQSLDIKSIILQHDLSSGHIGRQVTSLIIDNICFVFFFFFSSFWLRDWSLRSFYFKKKLSGFLDEVFDE